nr:hypothetical protein CFP56_78534 [Quercus suber]
MELEASSSSAQQSSIPAVDSIANPMVQDPPPLIATTTGPTDNGSGNERHGRWKDVYRSSFNGILIALLSDIVIIKLCLPPKDMCIHGSFPCTVLGMPQKL